MDFGSLTSVLAGICSALAPPSLESDSHHLTRNNLAYIYDRRNPKLDYFDNNFVIKFLPLPSRLDLP